jgi:hypothetical protein
VEIDAFAKAFEAMGLTSMLEGAVRVRSSRRPMRRSRSLNRRSGAARPRKTPEEQLQSANNAPLSEILEFTSKAGCPSTRSWSRRS